MTLVLDPLTGLGFELRINGVNHDEDFDRHSVDIRENLSSNGATMNINLQIDFQSFSNLLCGQVIQFWRDGVLEFAGRVVTAKQSQMGLIDHLDYALDCSDFTYDLSTKVIIGTFPAGLAGDFVRTVAGLALGFTSVNVADGPSILDQTVDREFIADLITKTAQSIEYQWFVDYNRDINFFYLLARIGPIGEIDVDVDSASYYDLEITEDAKQVKNALYIGGAAVKSTTQDTIVATGDGNTKFYALGYEPWSSQSSDTTVSLNGVPQQILLDGIDGKAGDGQGSPGQIYLCLSNHGVRFPDASPPNIGDAVNIAYNFVGNPIVYVEDPESIAIMKLRENFPPYAPSNGRHEFKYEIPAIRVTTDTAIVDYGNLILSRYSRIRYDITFKSRIQGWARGQYFQLVSPKRGINATVYVSGVQKHILGDTNTARFEYTITASTSPYPA